MQHSITNETKTWRLKQDFVIYCTRMTHCQKSDRLLFLSPIRSDKLCVPILLFSHRILLTCHFAFRIYRWSSGQSTQKWVRNHRHRSSRSSSPILNSYSRNRIDIAQKLKGLCYVCFTTFGFEFNQISNDSQNMTTLLYTKRFTWHIECKWEQLTIQVKINCR